MVTAMGSGSDEVALADATERLTYAAVIGDSHQAQAAFADILALGETESGPPSAEVREALVAADPVSAAAAGWLTFQELVELLQQTPEDFLDAAELRALTEFGVPILRLVVSNRLEGRPFQEALAGYMGNGQERYALAARGSVNDTEAVTALLREHGLIADEERGE